ncbi:MAG TPA: DUF4142 domain-containing protein [Verrucomicrobiae bacterium]|nr:DUF4142 domain-containing protein [Verrucomicrobiae bacterium]
MKLPIVVTSMSALILVGCAHHQRNDSMSTGAGGPVSVSQSGQSSSYLGDQEQTFLKEAAQGGLAEVQMGRLGAQKGQSQEVRQLGQKLVQDHSKANQELKLLAAQKSITLPTDIPTEHQSMLSHLKSLEGAEFDQAFKKHAVEDHQKDIQKFQTASQTATDSDIKAFAQKTLPVLQQHLKMAQDIKGEQTSTGSPTTDTSTSTGTPSDSGKSQSQP